MKKRKWAAALFALVLTALLFMAYPAAAEAPEAGGGEGQTEPPAYTAPRPEITLDSYQVVEGGLVAGGNVTIAFHFTNTSRSTDAYELTFTFPVDITGLYPIYGQSNQSFVERIPAGETLVLEKQFIISKMASELLEFPVGISYQAPGLSPQSTVATLALPIFGSDTVTTQINIGDTVIAGSEIVLSGYCGNVGSRDIVDVTLDLAGDLAGGPMTLELGDLSTGSQVAISQTIIFDEENTAAKLTVTFSFSDTEGNRITMTPHEYRITVLPPPDAAPDVGAGTYDQWLPLAAGGAVLVIAAALVIIVLRRRRNRY